MSELSWWVQQGDGAEILKTLPTASVDALVTDPPAGIGFMGKEWDGHKGGRDKWIAWLAGILAECRRVMKPGAYGWVWALPRTSHWTATACEDAGFAVRDVLTHVFGTGFPKSRALLKPAAEMWVLIKTPGELRELRIEENRIGTTRGVPASHSKTPANLGVVGVGARRQESELDPNMGRWPANFALSHNDACTLLGIKTVKNTSGSVSKDVPSTPSTNIYGDRERVAWQAHGDANGNEVVEAWQCVEGCPVKMLDEQSAERGMHSAGKARSSIRECASKGLFGLPGDGHRLGDSGGASRFFYVAKPSTKERSAGLPEGARNVHTTVKSVALMRHLVGLIAAPGDLVLDPFAGSGTTGLAALLQGCRFVGVEQSEEYCEIARRRILHHAGHHPRA